MSTSLLWLKICFKKGVILPSSSHWASKPHLVRKNNATYRFGIDFCPLNKVTQHDVYPLPRLDDLLDELGKSRCFLSLDLQQVIGRYPYTPKTPTKPHSGVRTPCGLYQFTRMPLGLSDANSIYQRMSNTIFKVLICKKYTWMIF